MKVWITKYALTAGIREEIVETTHNPSMVCRKGGGHLECFHGEGKDWHRSFAGAVNRAKEMQANKLASLRKSIAKMEKLRFE